MDLRGIVNQVSDTVNLNIIVTIRTSAGFTIGAGLRQVPLYNDPIVGPAQIQALDNSDLRQIDGLNIQGAIRALYMKGNLAGVIRPDSKGGDLVSITAPAPLPLQGLWLTSKSLESWSDWTKIVIVKQETGYYSGSGAPYTGYAANETPLAVIDTTNQFALNYPPNPAQGLLLFVRAIGFGWILLAQDVDYTLSGITVTIINGQTYGADFLRAWYPY